VGKRKSSAHDGAVAGVAVPWTFIVKWYGGQPVDAAWYLARAHGL